MEKDWRKELETHPKLVALRRSLWSRWRKLGKDKEFVQETERLKQRLERAYAKNPKAVILFLRRYADPTGLALRRIPNYIKSIKDEKLRRLFRRYVAYATRFGVIMRYTRREPRFRLEALLPWGSKFHVTLVNDHFEAAEDHPNDDVPAEYFFESENVPVTTVLEELIRSGKAKFVQINDRKWSSVLSQLEEFGYHAEGITFVLHKAERPYLLCLIGEKVSNLTWREASKVVSSLLRKYYRRGTAGRPLDTLRLRAAVRLRRLPGSLKEKGYSLTRGQISTSSAQSYMSRVPKLLD